MQIGPSIERSGERRGRNAMAATRLSLLFLAGFWWLSGEAGAQGTPIGCDSPVTACLGSTTAVDRYTLGVSEGETVAITVVNDAPSGVNFNVAWRLLTATGAAATSCGTFRFGRYDCGPLPASGSPYTIEVSDSASNDTGCYAIHVQRLTAATACEAIPLGCDAAPTDTISSKVESDLFRPNFTIAEGEIIEVNVINDPPVGANFNVSWRLLTGAGAPAVACGTFRFGRYDCGPLPASGNPYRVEVLDSASNATGNYLVNVQRLTAAGACEAITLPCDAAPTDTISSKVESDLFRPNFTVTEGEIIEVNVINDTPVGANFNASWRLLTGAGTPAVACGTFRFGLYDCGPLPASGNPYRVEVLDSGSNDTGNYRIHVQRLTAAGACEGTALPCDGSLTDAVNSTVDSDLFRFAFTVAEGEIVAVNVANDTPVGLNFNATWRLLTGAGTPAVACGSYRFGRYDCGPLPASGNPYRVEVLDSLSNDTGNYRLHVQRLTAAVACEAIPLACDGALTGTIDSKVESDLFRLNFTVGEGEIIDVNAINDSPVGVNFNASWRLLTGAGTPAAVCGTFRFGLYDCGPLPASGNPYSIEVLDSGTNDVGNYATHVQRLTAAGACEASTDCRIGTRIDTDLQRLPFSVTEGQTVNVNVVSGTPAGPNFNAAWRLLTSAGAPAVACGTYRFGRWDCGPLPTSSNQNPYQIEILDSGSNDTGPYSVLINTVAQPCGTTTTTTSTSTSTTTTTICSVVLGVGNGRSPASTAEFCVPLNLTNGQSIRAVNAAVVDVPDEFQLSRVICTSRTPGFSCQGNEMSATNRINVVIVDTAGACIAAGTGAIAQICLTDRAPLCPLNTTVQVNVDPGSVQVANCSNQGCDYSLSNGAVRWQCGGGLLGDCNNDGSFNLFDVLTKIDRHRARASDADGHTALSLR